MTLMRRSGLHEGIGRELFWRLLRRIATVLGTIVILVASSPVLAGPPYLSDDPEPTDVGHWEIYNFAIGLGGPGGLAGEAGLDLNYGLAKDWQLTAVLPLAFGAPDAFSESGLRAGPGDVELAIKSKFLHQSEGTWTPDVAFFPRLFVPTADRALGTGRVGLLLPIWAQKDFGPWSVFGGGGYQINPGQEQRDFWQGGGALSRSFGERLSLGAELYAQTRDTYAGGAYTTLNLALTYRLTRHWSLLGSAGPAWDRVSADGYVFYGALKADY
jgi:hypothetical protein